MADIRVDNTITGTGDHILVHYLGWAHNEDGWEVIDISEKGAFALKLPGGGAETYEIIGGVCYKGRHFIYKHYKRQCVSDKEVVS